MISMPARIRLILLEADYQPVSLLLALMSVVWGGWLLLPLNTFADTEVYRVLRTVAPEDLWGLWMMGMGVVMTLLSINVLRPRVRDGVAFANALTWLVIAVTTLYGNSSSTGPAMYLIIGLAAAWVYMRVSLEH